MSSELERLLRQARRTLPGPSSAATRRARALALSRRKGGLRRRSALALAAALLVATGLGVGLGALVAPSGTAASGPRGVGFLPERGWSVIQNGGEGTQSNPTAAIAANVPLLASDDPDGLPYETLQALPPGGVVIVAGFIERGDPFLDSAFPPRSLPLRVGAAERFGAQVRPARPLGQYQLRAAVNGYNVDLMLYFGDERPSPSLLSSAQRQLDRLVARSAGTPTRKAEWFLPSAGAPSGAVFDRTMLCSVETSGGVRELKILTSAGYRNKGAWGRLPFAVVSTGRTASLATTLDDTLAWVSAGKPAPTTDLMDSGVAGTRILAQQYGTLAVNTRACSPSKARVPLTATGLRDAAPGPLGVTFDCRAPARVLVRVRTLTQSASPPLYRDRYFTKSKEGFRESYVVVRTRAGKQLVLAAAFENGKARLLTSNNCEED